jgi:hypothetical protein
MYAYNSLDGNAHSSFCHNCKTPKPAAAGGCCVMSTNIRKKTQVFRHAVNRYTKFDPTLPRIDSIPCPKAECKSNASGEDHAERDIVYKRYDDNNMEYLYICVLCDTVWTTHS